MASRTNKLILERLEEEKKRGDNPRFFDFFINLFKIQAEVEEKTSGIKPGVGKDEIERGQVIAKPGTITPHTHFKSQIYVLTKKEGGRHTAFFSNYRPQFYFRTTDVTGGVTLPEGVEMVMPGDNVELTVKLVTPIAMEKGQRFAIREGGRTVGAGTVTEVIE